MRATWCSHPRPSLVLGSRDRGDPAAPRVPGAMAPPWASPRWCGALRRLSEHGLAWPGATEHSARTAVAASARLLAPGTCATLLSHSPVPVLLPPPLVLATVAPPRGEACRAHALLPCHARCASVCCCAVAVLVVVLLLRWVAMLLRWVAVLLLLCCSCCWAPLALAIVAMAMPVLVLLLCAALPCLCARFPILSACLCLPFLLDSSSVPLFMLLCLPDTQVCSFILPWPDDSVSFLQFCKCQSHCVLFLVLKFMIMLN
jgi:hypothetical protein